MRSLIIIISMNFLLLRSLSWAQAPGDEDDRCTVDYNDPPVYPDTQKNLMDSWNYVNLLPGNGTGRTPIATAVWNDYSYDGNDQVNLFTQTYWQQTSGGICRFISKVCGYAIGTQNNWLFAQYINKSFDTNTYNYDVTIRVTISYSMTSCRSNRIPSCVQGITLLRYMANSTLLPNLEGNGYMNRNNYQIFAYPSAQANNVPYTNTYTFTLPASTTGFYVAVRDNGTCMSISRLRVYRNNCMAQQVGLVLYPDAPAPVSGSADINVSCVENAEFSSGHSKASCTSNGTWGTLTPVCECGPGYERIEVYSVSQCRACEGGQFCLGGNEGSHPCPANTILTENAAPCCLCISDYYRYDVNKTDPRAREFLPPVSEQCFAGCTTSPGPPRSVSLTPQARSITVKWQAPSDNGGRNDVYYNLSRSDADNVHSFTLPAHYLSGSTRSYSFTGLNPSTEYCVRVTSNNGVSFQDPGRVHLKTVEKCTTTLADRPGRVEGVQGRCPYVVWNPPEQPNGVITGYRLVFSRSGTTTTRTITTNNDQTFYIIRSADIPLISGEFRVTVAAKNSAGVGPQSTPFTLQLDSSCPSITPTSTTSVTDHPTISSSCPTLPTPTCSPCTFPTPMPPPPIGSVTSVEVLGCGVISWKPPPGNEGIELGYAVRFFDGPTYDSSSNREIQRYFDDTGRQWAVAGTSVNDGGTLYADIRARDSNERLGAYSGRFLVANSSICTKKCSTKNEALVYYPTALAPDSGSVSVTTQCADNAQLRSGYSLNVRCNSDGTWSGVIPQCQCNSGYRVKTVSGRQICEAIPRCEAKTEGLVSYPLTLAPNSGSSTTVQCVDNAQLRSGSLSVRCNSDGTWSGNPQCQCNSGYQQDGQICRVITIPTPCPTTACPTQLTLTCPPCPTPSCPPCPDSATPPPVGSVTSVEVLGCGVISWKPPPGNEGLKLGYIIRFFDGPTYDSSPSREIQRRFSDIGRQWAVASSRVNDGGTLYADMRARDSTGRLGAYSGRFLVANSSICIKKCSAKDEGLVRYPTALAPDSGSVSVTTQCADNAQLRSGYSLSVRCNSDGTWSGTIPQCQCNNGYRTNSSGSICEAIPFCPAKIEGLVHYPSTSAPNTNSRSVTTRCADNAASGSLSVRCNSDGTWSGTIPTCTCNSGYRVKTVSGRQFCETIPTCEAKTEYLVSYSSTSAPNSGFTIKTVQCVGNATLRSGSLSVRCNSDGTWSGNPQCQCNSGYQQDGQICRIITMPPTPCPTTACPTQPTPTCPPCLTPTSSPSIFKPPCDSSDRTRPNDITGLIKINCTSIRWDVAEVDGCIDRAITYRIRLFNGTNYESSPSNRVVLSLETNFLTFTTAQVPFRGSVKAMVKARRGNGVFSRDWPTPIIVRDNLEC